MASGQIHRTNLGILLAICIGLSGSFCFAQTSGSPSLEPPVLRIDRDSDQSLKVTFPSVAKQKYQLAFSRDFRSWDLDGQMFDGTGGLVTLEVAKPVDNTRFFRVTTSPVPAAATDQTRIIGVWRGGWPSDTQPTYELVITPEKITATNPKDGTSYGEGTYQLDPAKKTIDATMTVNPGKGRIFLGIYSLEGDTFKWCSNNGTRVRPTELAFKPSLDHYLLVLKRQ